MAAVTNPPTTQPYDDDKYFDDAKHDCIANCNSSFPSSHYYYVLLGSYITTKFHCIACTSATPDFDECKSCELVGSDVICRACSANFYIKDSSITTDNNRGCTKCEDAD